jgi:NADH-quinone oxidoreductase subunit F
MSKLNSIKELDAYREQAKVSFYHNKTTITICNGTGCNALGGEAVKNNFIREIEKQNLQDKVELITTGCHGFCEKGPIVVILPKKIFYKKVAIEDIEEIISKTILNDEIIERLLYQDPITGEKITHVHEIPFYTNQKRIVFARNGQIDPTQINHYIALDGYTALSKALTSMSPEEIIEEIKKSGLRGRGGGGFPTGLKWELTRQAKGDKKYIICNADEGDPGAFMDRSILEGDPHSVIEGMLICAYAIGASEGYIYVRTEYPIAVTHLSIAIKQAKELGLLGKNILGTDFSFHLKIKEGAGAFVCGEETGLIASIEGKRGMPKPRPPYPAISGLWGKPTNINNVETFANIATIILKGANWFSNIGTEKSKGTKIFSLAGKINNTGLIEVPMGTTLKEIIFDIGGGMQKNKKFKAVQLGGPSGGCIPSKYLDLPIDYDSFKEVGAIMGSGGMVVMDESNCMVEIARFFLEFTQSESCGKCVPCRMGTKRMLEILTRITQGKGTEEDIDRLYDLSNMIKDTSLCGLGQTAPNPVLSTLQYFKDEYYKHIVDKKCSALVCENLFVTPCEDTCPVGIEVHHYTVLIAEERFHEALELIKERNPFPLICSRVCHHPCETNCRRGKIDKPIALRALKRFVADQELSLEAGTPKIKLAPTRMEKIAIIGSGPSGLSCAYHLAKCGFKVTIFEASETPGGMLSLGIPNYRLPRRILRLEIDNIINLGVEIITKVEIGKDKSFKELLEEFDSIFIACGFRRNQKLNVSGEDSEGVVEALDFLSDVNLGNPIKIGKKIVVIGGGYPAIDAARSALRFGADEVSIIYKSTEDETPIGKEGIDRAIQEGIKVKYLTSPVRILSSNGKIEGLECVKMKLGEFDKTGKRRVIPIEDSNFIIECDMIINATGQSSDFSFLEGLIETTPKGTIKVNPQTLKTNIPKVYAGGDCVTGPNTVIDAIASGYKAGVSIDKDLSGGIETMPRTIKKREFPPVSRGISGERKKGLKRQRLEMPTISNKEGIKSFDEIELGFTKEMAIKEAQRCLRCHERA